MKKKIKRPLICIYFILLGCLFVSTALSKNSSKIEGKGSVEVAGIKLDVDCEKTNISNLSNAQQEINFTVKNYEGTIDSLKINEIQYDYQIEIKNDSSVPVEYELYKISSGNETKITVTNGKAEQQTMKHSEVQEDKYVLKVKNTSKDYKNVSGNLNIDVYAVQSK